MPRMLELNDGKREALWSERDFARLIETYMGWDAADYFNDLVEELECHKERNEELEKILEENMDYDE